MRLSLLLTYFLMIPTLSTAYAKSTWTILPINSRGVSKDHTDTFHDLLQHELSNQTGQQFVTSTATCKDVPCAEAAGQSAGADVVVFGSINELGGTYIIAVTAVNVGEGIRSSQRMTVDQISDLSTAAGRLAGALVSGQDVSETAELGSVTRAEVQPERRREGYSGPTLRVGGVIPVGDGYANVQGGMLIDFVYWYETLDFAIAPKTGLRFDATDDGNDFIEIPLEVQAYYLFSRGDFTPVAGLGGGMRFLSETRFQSVTHGEVIKTTTMDELEDSAFGFSLSASAGFMLFRTYSMSVSMLVDYNITFVELNGVKNPQSLNASFGVHF